MWPHMHAGGFWSAIFFPGNAIEHLTKYLGFCEWSFKVMEVLPFLGGSERSMANIYPKKLTLCEQGPNGNLAWLSSKGLNSCLLICFHIFGMFSCCGLYRVGYLFIHLVLL